MLSCSLSADFFTDTLDKMWFWYFQLLLLLFTEYSISLIIFYVLHAEINTQSKESEQKEAKKRINTWTKEEECLEVHQANI